MAMKREMLNSLRHCCHDNDMESKIFYSLATVLDSRFKLLVFSSAAAAALCKQMLIAEYEKLAGGKPHDSHEATEPPPKNWCTEASPASPSLLWRYCNELIQEKSDSGNSSCSPESVVEAYLKEGSIPRRSDPLQYWKERSATSPILASLARQYHSAPPASASERLFSTVANICTDSCNHLSEDKLEMFLGKNLLDFEY